jgi:hypothetical protein
MGKPDSSYSNGKSPSAAGLSFTVATVFYQVIESFRTKVARRLGALAWVSSDCIVWPSLESGVRSQPVGQMVSTDRTWRDIVGRLPRSGETLAGFA